MPTLLFLVTLNAQISNVTFNYCMQTGLFNCNTRCTLNWKFSISKYNFIIYSSWTLWIFEWWPFSILRTMYFLQLENGSVPGTVSKISMKCYLTHIYPKWMHSVKSNRKVIKWEVYSTMTPLGGKSLIY